MAHDVPQAAAQSRHIGRSLLALICGFVVALVLSLASDLAVHVTGLWPDMDRPMSSKLFVVATLYRTIYGVVSGYVVARLSPYSPLGHALVGGCIGVVLSIVGAAATWNEDLGPHWYPLALVVVALPAAWAGGILRVRQLARSSPS